MEISDQQIARELLLLLSRIKHNAHLLAEEKGITRIQLYALYLIYERDELAMHELASFMQCDASNVTGVVDRLVSQGIVKRKENPKDRRFKLLELTDKGRGVMAAIEAELPDRIGSNLLSRDERHTLHTVIQKMI